MMSSRPDHTCRRVQRKTLVTLLVGAIIGVLISPFTFLVQDPQLVSLNPLCTQYDSSWDSSKKTTTQMYRSIRPGFSEQPGFTPNVTFSPPQFPHNKSALSQEELQSNIPPPQSPQLRFRELSNELAPRKLLFVGVVTAKKYLNTRALGIYRTWGKEVPDLKFFSSQSDDENLHLPIITLPGINDTQYPPQRKVYHMLKYMHDHYIDQFDFFMRSDDDVYVKVDRMMELLKNTNPAQDIYMGCPGFGRPDDRDRIKLTAEEHYCMGGPGVIFSRSALRKLAPHLDECLKSVVVSYNEDVEVGRCVSKMLRLQCTWAWETSTLFWTDYKRILPSPELYTTEDVKKAISLHPLKDPKLMYRVHQYLQEVRIKQLMHKASSIQEDVKYITSLLPKNMSRYDHSHWLWYELDSIPKSRHEVVVWEYFNSTRLFLTYEHMPVVGLPASLKTGINSALEILLDMMNAKEGNSHPFIPPYHLFDGFTVTDQSSGVYYTLHMSVHREGMQDPVDYIANVFLPFQGAGMGNYQESSKLLSTTVNVIVGVPQVGDISEFLRMYEVVSLQPGLRTHLHVVLFKENKNMKSKVTLLQKNYPRQNISIHQSPTENFSHASAYDHVARKLGDTELMVFFDYNIVYTAEFLDHCRINAVRGRQVYFPVLFSFYKPELVHKYIQRPPQMLISADTGFFLRYNYQVVVIYKSDYRKMGGFGTNQGSLNDDVRFVDKVLSSGLRVMRALEPYLRRYYKPRTCKGLTGNTHSACMNSRADAIGSKKILGSLIVNHGLLDKT